MAGIGSVNFGGLASGLDTQQIIEDLISVDSRPLERLESRKSDLSDKSTTFDAMKTNLLELKEKAFEVKSTSTLGVFSASSSDEEALTLNVSTSAISGNYSIKILSLAQAKTLSSKSFDDTETDLGLTGEIFVSGNNFKVRISDSLIDIRNAINALDVGVNANILKVSDSDSRLIISSENMGSDGFHIANVGDIDLLGELGFTDGTKDVRKVQDGNVLSEKFVSSTSTIGSLIGLSSGASGTVKIRNTDLSLDLSKDTLSSIRDKINDLSINGVSASVESFEEDGETFYRLAITGTEDFTDDDNVLETLGILAGGTSGVEAEFETTTLYTINEQDNGKTAGENTSLSKLGAEIGGITETITISGTNIDGSNVSKTIEIEHSTKIRDVLENIEEAFSNNVSAEIMNGKINIESNVAGQTDLEIRITANNENGGTLDFGTITNIAKGRDRILVEGNDAKLLVNNVEVTRSENEINDVLTGLSLTLKKVDTENEINITVEQDHSAVYGKIEDFVKSYNTFIDFVNENSEYDQETREAGILLGDMTTTTAVRRLQKVFQAAVYDTDLTYNHLAQVGIELTVEGTLKLNSSELNDAMNEDIDAVIALFTVSRFSSDNDINFVYNSTKTQPGTYDVTVTRAAEKAEAVSDTIEGEIGESETILITDNYDNAMSVNYSEDNTVEDIANLINSEAQKTYTEIQESSIALLQSGGIEPIDQNTTIGDIYGVSVEEDDTITMSVTNRLGKSYQRILTLSEGDSYTIQDILDNIESLNDNQVNASINAEGRIVVQDKTAGSSKINLSIQTTVQGLDFGDVTTVQKGRSEVNISAVVSDDNRLEIAHNSFGSRKTFTISGAGGLGITDDEYQGVDVAGTINGTEGTGSGRTLNASNSDESASGVIISVSLTPEELEAEGSAQGSVTVISGIADRLYNELSFITQPIDGFVLAKIDSLKLEVDSIQSRINVAEQRLEQRRAMYVQKFTKMEQAMSRLQAMQQRLSASLSSLSWGS